MSLQVVFRPEAEGEALDVRHWYESRSPGLGEQFSEALASVISRITESPLAFTARRDEPSSGGFHAPSTFEQQST